MTTYTNIPDNEVDQDSPVTQPLVTALRDNPIAIAEGAAGAPRLSLLAIERLTAGTTIRSRDDASQSGSIGDPETPSFLFSFMQYGTVRVAVDVSNAGFSRVVRIKRTRNAVATTLVTYNSSGSKALDVDVLPGDQLLITRQDSVLVANQRIQTGGENLWPGSIARLENNNAT